MPPIAWRVITVSLGLLLTLSVTSALAVPSTLVRADLKPGCPVITRAQAEAALGKVTKIEHHAQHTPGLGGGITWLQHCTVHFQGNSVQITFGGDDRQAFDGMRRQLRVAG